MINKSNASFLETELETPQNVIGHAKPWKTPKLQRAEPRVLKQYLQKCKGKVSGRFNHVQYVNFLIRSTKIELMSSVARRLSACKYTN